MQELKKMGKPNTALIYRRHGVAEETFGVPYSALGSLVKRIGVDHGLALELWKTKNHDARVLATKVASPSEMNASDFATWLKDCTNYVIVDAVSGLAARAPKAEALAAKWTAKDEEWTSAAGWNVFALQQKGNSRLRRRTTSSCGSSARSSTPQTEPATR